VGEVKRAADELDFEQLKGVYFVECMLVRIDNTPTVMALILIEPYKQK
jgi:hypothetical protein